MGKVFRVGSRLLFSEAFGEETSSQMRKHNDEESGGDSSVDCSERGLPKMTRSYVYGRMVSELAAAFRTNTRNWSHEACLSYGIVEDLEFLMAGNYNRSW